MKDITQSLAYVDQLIADGGYDYDLSMDALVNYAQSSAGYDVCYILAAYSASMQQQNMGKDDMVSKLRGCAGGYVSRHIRRKAKKRLSFLFPIIHISR